MPVQSEQQKKSFHRKTLDRDILVAVGTFPLICCEELSVLLERPYGSIVRKVRELQGGLIEATHGVNEVLSYFKELACEFAPGMVHQIPLSTGRQKSTPKFLYLNSKGEREALKHVSNVIAWDDKSRNIVDHDRGITLVHLALHSNFPLSAWGQQRDSLKETVELNGKNISFYPDASFLVVNTMYYLEYQHSNPSSKNGETDLDVKVKRYNALLKKRKDAKVIFVFREEHHVKNFLNRIEEEYPYRWLWATDIESIKHDPTGSIFRSPKDGLAPHDIGALLDTVLP